MTGIDGMERDNGREQKEGCFNGTGYFTILNGMHRFNTGREGDGLPYNELRSMQRPSS